MSIDEQVRSFDVDLAAFGLLTGAERDAVLVAHEREIGRLLVGRAAMIRHVAVTESFADDAHHSVRAWVEAVLNTSRTTAGELVRTATVLAEIPGLADAVAVGRVVGIRSGRSPA